MRLCRSIGTIHFVGIGGIGMSGIAGCAQSGCFGGGDIADSANVRRLREAASQSPWPLTRQPGAAQVVVVSSAVKTIRKLRRARLIPVRRTEILAGDAAEMVDCDWRHARQDHGHQHDRRGLEAGHLDPP